jgi:hypothetical protein
MPGSSSTTIGPAFQRDSDKAASWAMIAWLHTGARLASPWLHKLSGVRNYSTVWMGFTVTITNA